MRILVVEDDPDIRLFLKSGLEEQCYTVDTAEDGERGSYMARTNGYDLVVLDNVLPHKEGLQVCQEIRRSGKSMPILILSVQTEVGQKVELLNCGADDYLTKPFSFDELLARTRALLRRPPAVEDEVLQAEDLTLNLQSHLAYRGSREIYLTRKEFQLLEYLMRNQGRVVSRGMIMEHVWDMNADPFSNTIETHILNLRRKVDQRGKKLIYTVPGRGYKLVV